MNRIIRLIKSTYNGEPWHGPSIVRVIDNVDADKAFRHIPPIHTIAELVKHMSAWRQYAIRRLQGDHKYLMSDREDWTPIARQDEATWQAIKQQLNDSQTHLIHTLENTEDDVLSTYLEDKSHDYYTMLHGVIQHDIYHQGQIILLSKM